MNDMDHADLYKIPESVSIEEAFKSVSFKEEKEVDFKLPDLVYDEKESKPICTWKDISQDVVAEIKDIFDTTNIHHSTGLDETLGSINAFEKMKKDGVISPHQLKKISNPVEIFPEVTNIELTKKTEPQKDQPIKFNLGIETDSIEDSLHEKKTLSDIIRSLTSINENLLKLLSQRPESKIIHNHYYGK